MLISPLNSVDNHNYKYNLAPTDLHESELIGKICLMRLNFLKN
jgi:hypothetical protein